MAGGPKIQFLAGRKDADVVSPPGRLPIAAGDAKHLRDIFYRMGFEDREIVVLSGGHTLGRAHPERSGFEGQWTIQPFKFDNSYFSELLEDPPKRDRIQLPTDRCLVTDKRFCKYVELYAKDNDLFFQDYATAHKKLSELGFKQFPQPHRQIDVKKVSIILGTSVISVALLGFLSMWLMENEI